MGDAQCQSGLEAMRPLQARHVDHAGEWALPGLPSAPMGVSVRQDPGMQVVRTPIAGLLVLEPHVCGDASEFCMESWNHDRFAELTGLRDTFVQDNHSRSARGVLRGLHYQLRQPQGKLARVTRGEVFDVAVDLRRRSPTFGQWFGVTLSGGNHCQLWVPAGFAHGFVALSDSADFLYKTTDYYAPQDERCVAWNDPQIGIAWPLDGLEPSLSAKDRTGVSLAQAEVFA